MKVSSQKTLVVLLGTDLDLNTQMQWAVRLASARKLDMLILHRLESKDDRIVEISLDDPPKGEASGVIQKINRFIEESPELRSGPREITAAEEGGDAAEQQVVHVRLKFVYFSSLMLLRRSILNELGSKDVELFTEAGKDITDMTDVDLIRERRLFLRYMPCEVVLCLGLEKDKSMSRILVPTAPGPSGRAALQLGADLAAAATGTVTALHVNPNIGVDAERVGERRVERHIKKTLGSRHHAVNRKVVVNNQVEKGIRAISDEGNHDLVVVGMSGAEIERTLGSKLGKGMTVVIDIIVSPFANQFKEFIEEGLQRFVPQIARENRISLVDRLQSNAEWNFDFVALMVLSTTMAAIGLIQNSAAVVIGAMLVAPLMTPLLGLGLALVQSNPVLAKLSLRSVILGLCVSLAGGFLVGIATTSFEEPTRQMLARGGPGLLDLSVAFAAGLAAAYASSRPSLIAALPGVAIAAALVPPIATSGLALSLGDFSLAIGALLLFIINMVTIVLASMTSLWIVGLRNLKKTSRWTRMAGSAVMASVLALGVYLSLQPKEYELTEELPAGLVHDVQEQLGTGYRLDGLAVAYDELGVQLNLQIAGKEPVSEALATEVRSVASDLYEQPVRVRLLTQIEFEADARK